ncbi:FAR1-related sequence 5 [Striga asiatica]|uniref:FAR1-related sequence 5 n=1 Tax=Striga asiatica TaxID=4170 RepID=A0A5A7PTL5_STRAF|nr:FAR1-related sequence 5 [Striga asiatica]
MYACNKEGKTDETWQTKKKNMASKSGERKRGHIRCGYQAKMRVKKSQDDGMWIVSCFIEQHNHHLTNPSKVHLLPSHRIVSTTKKALVQQFSEANIPNSQHVRLFEIEVGGPSMIGCLEKDIRNHKRDILRRSIWTRCRDIDPTL